MRGRGQQGQEGEQECTVQLAASIDQQQGSSAGSLPELEAHVLAASSAHHLHDRAVATGKMRYYTCRPADSTNQSIHTGTDRPGDLQHAVAR